MAADDGTHGDELWSSGGTAPNTQLVRDIQPGPASSSPSALAAISGVLYFNAFEPTHGDELWKAVP